MDWKVGVALSIVAVLAGCTTVDVGGKAIDGDLKSVALTGYTAIVPTTSPRVGRLYFSGEGRRPAFVTADGTVYNELCYDDFTSTGALAAIDKYVVDEGISHSKKTMTGGLTGSASLSTSKVKSLGDVAIGLDGNRNRTYVIEKVHKLALSDAGLQVVMNKIQDGCKLEIAKLRKTRDVIIAMRAQRAEKATDSRTVTYNGTLGASVGGAIASDKAKVTVTGKGAGIGVGSSHVVTDEYELVYLSVAKQDF